MRYLLDTNVLSELNRPEGNPNVRKRFSNLDPKSLFLSVITIGEICKGVAKLPKRKKRSNLEGWLLMLEVEFGDKILPFGIATAQLCGGLVADAERQGNPIGLADGQIAATALDHGLVVVTRNTKDFLQTGVRLWNIWETDTPGSHQS